MYDCKVQTAYRFSIKQQWQRHHVMPNRPHKQWQFPMGNFLYKKKIHRSSAWVLSICSEWNITYVVFCQHPNARVFYSAAIFSLEWTCTRYKGTAQKIYTISKWIGRCASVLSSFRCWHRIHLAVDTKGVPLPLLPFNFTRYSHQQRVDFMNLERTQHKHHTHAVTLILQTLRMDIRAMLLPCHKQGLVLQHFRFYSSLNRCVCGVLASKLFAICRMWRWLWLFRRWWIKYIKRAFAANSNWRPLVRILPTVRYAIAMPCF